MDIHLATVTGRLGQDLKKDKYGNDVFSIAVNYKKEKLNEPKPPCIWYTVTCGKGISENFLSFLKKGTRVFVVLDIKNFFVNSDNNVSVYGFSNCIKFLPSENKNGNNSFQNSQNGQNQQQQGQYSEFPPIKEEDLPF